MALYLSPALIAKECLLGLEAELERAGITARYEEAPDLVKHKWLLASVPLKLDYRALLSFDLLREVLRPAVINLVNHLQQNGVGWDTELVSIRPELPLGLEWSEYAASPLLAIRLLRQFDLQSGEKLGQLSITYRIVPLEHRAANQRRSIEMLHEYDLATAA